MTRTGILLTAIVLLHPWAAAGQDAQQPQSEQWFKQVDAAQLADLEKNVQEIYARVAPSVVRIFSDDPASQNSFSGVIVSRSGEIFTCAHHDLPPSTQVTVELADGRRVQGTTLGLFKKSQRISHYRAHDIGMLRLKAGGDWPALELAPAHHLQNGQFCLSIGYPYGHHAGQPPLLRLGRILPPSFYGEVRASCRTVQGDSGGPLLDLEGRVLAALSGQPSFKWAGGRYVSADVFSAFRQVLREEQAVIAEKEAFGRPIHPPHDLHGAFQPAEELVRTIGAAHLGTVEILGAGTPIALGLVVGQEGWIVTKRTELAGREPIACRLSDGRLFEARAHGESSEHDLALLKVEASLPQPDFASAEAPRIGQVIASLSPQPRPLHFAVVGGVHVANPPIKGFLPISGQRSTTKEPSGHVVTEIWPNRPDVGDLNELLKAGDLVTHVDDVPTPTADEYVRVRDQRIAAAESLIGERIKLTVLRGNEVRQIFAPIVSEVTMSAFVWKQCPRSLRRNGFPHVFSHDGGIAPDQCGGPVVNRSGQVIGINIARADEVQTFAIPIHVVQQAVAELLRQADP